jgi:hypothetical protein
MLELLELPVLAAALGLLDVLGVDDEPLLPHAESPTTAAAARTEAANHRLRIVPSPFITVSRSAYTHDHVPPGGVVQALFRSASDGDPLA